MFSELRKNFKHIFSTNSSLLNKLSMVSGCRISSGKPMQISHFPGPALPSTVGHGALLRIPVYSIQRQRQEYGQLQVSLKLHSRTCFQKSNRQNQTNQASHPHPGNLSQSSLKQAHLCVWVKTKPLPVLSLYPVYCC